MQLTMWFLVDSARRKFNPRKADGVDLVLSLFPVQTFWQSYGNFGGLIGYHTWSGKGATSSLVPYTKAKSISDTSHVGARRVVYDSCQWLKTAVAERDYAIIRLQ